MDPNTISNTPPGPPMPASQPISEQMSQGLYIESQPQDKHKYRMIIVTILVLMIAIISFVFFQRFANEKKSTLNSQNTPNQISARDGEYLANGNTTTANISPVPLAKTGITDEKQPWFKLVSEENKTNYAVGEEMHFLIKGFSQNRDINGYDILLALDTEMIDIISIESVPRTFQIKQLQKKTHITIIGFKDLQVNTPTSFDDDTIIKITARAKKTGQSTISILPEVKKEKTKMVDKQVQIIAPQLESIQVAIQ